MDLFLFIECFIPDFGFFGITGLVCLVGGIVANAVLTKSIAQTLFLIALFAVVLFILFLIFIRSAKYGLIKATEKTDRIHRRAFRGYGIQDQRIHGANFRREPRTDRILRRLSVPHH